MAEPGPDFRHLTRRRWYLVAGGWAVLLTIPATVAATSEHPGWLRTLLTLAVVVYALLYVLGLYEVMFKQRAGWWAAGLLVVMAALWTTMAAEGSAVIALSYLVVSVLAVLPPRWGAPAALLTAAAAAGFVWLVRGTIQPGDLIGMAAIAMAQIGMFGLIRINSELRGAREELARLAVTEERERMSRDLHDVLGHSL